MIMDPAPSPAQRNFWVAKRDPTLYFLQFILHAFYGFLVGAIFYDLRPTIDSRLNDMFS